MFDRVETAFKHPGCGGVIFAYVWPTRTRYKCEKCGKWGDDVAELALGHIVRSNSEIAEDPAAADGET